MLIGACSRGLVRCLMTCMAAAMCAFLVTASAQVLPPPASSVPLLEGEPVLAGDAAVVGRVIDSRSGVALAGVFIQLASADLRRVSMSRTDEHGRYAFGGIAPGEYRLVAKHEGYIDQTYGAPDARMGLITPDAVVAVDRTTDTRVDFALMRMGVIGGRVLTEDGKPLRNATVTLTMITERGISVRGRWGARTNERGEYVVGNVPEGTFQVSAVWTDDEVPSGISLRQRQIYYPGTELPERATSLMVTAGQTIKNVDIVLPAGELVRIQGNLVAGNSAGPFEAYLLDGVSVQSVPTAEDGSFSTTRLSAGRYTLIARSNGYGSPEVAWLTVDLSSELTGLVLGLMPSGVIAGRVVTDDGSAVPQTLEVTAVLADQGKEIDLLLRDPRDRTAISGTGVFQLRGMFGERVLRIVGDTNGLVIDRVMVGKTRISSLKISPGSVIDDVTIIVTRSPG